MSSLKRLCWVTFLFSSITSAMAIESELFKHDVLFVTPHSSSSYPSFLEIGDYDGDSHLDVLYVWSYFTRGISSEGAVLIYPSLSETVYDVRKYFYKRFADWPTFIEIFTGDWNGDGKDDFLRITHEDCDFYISSDVGIVESSDYHANSELTGDGASVFVTGDFNGDHNVDVFIYRKGSEEKRAQNLFWGNGDGSFDLLTHPTEGAGSPAVIDWNGDHLDDIAIPHEQSIRIYSGNTIQSASFPLSYVIDLPFSPSNVCSWSDSSNGDVELFAANDGYLQYLRLHNSTVIDNHSISVSTAFKPGSILVDDFNTDGIPDVFTRENTRLSFLFGDQDRMYINRMEYDITYMDNITTLKVADMNNDGKPDILFKSDFLFFFDVNQFQTQYMYYNPEVVVLYNQIPSFTYPATIVPTIKPTPTIRPTPVPLPIEIPPGAITIGPEIDLNQTLQSAPEYSTWILEPGNYSIKQATHITNPQAIIQITGKKLTLIGKDIDNPPLITGNFWIQNSTIYMQNIRMDPYKVWPESPLIYLNNSSGVFIDNQFTSPYQRRRYAYYQMIPSTNQSIRITNCKNQHVSFINNTIQSDGIPYILSISDSSNITMQFSNNYLAGRAGVRYGTGGTPIKITDSSRVKIHLDSDTFQGGASRGNGLYVSNSSVFVQGGTLIGGDGNLAIQGTNGGVGVSAVESSVVHLYDVTIQGGKGGDGVIPGADGAPYYADETSQVLFLSTVNEWREY